MIKHAKIINVEEDAVCAMKAARVLIVWIIISWLNMQSTNSNAQNVHNQLYGLRTETSSFTIKASL